MGFILPFLKITSATGFIGEPAVTPYIDAEDSGKFAM